MTSVPVGSTTGPDPPSPRPAAPPTRRDRPDRTGHGGTRVTGTGGTTGTRPDRFPAELAAVAAVAAGIQLLFIHAVARGTTLSAAASYDTAQARLLLRGDWFVDPAGALSASRHLVPTAAHPPLPSLLLGVADVAGATGPTAHRLLLGGLFVATVVLAGVAVRDLVGDRAGILAALCVATFPPLWVNPATLGPETTVVVVTALILFAAVRFWNRPGTAHAALVGFAVGLGALTRADLVALVVLVALPLGLAVRNVTWGVRLRSLAVMAVLVVVVVGPWVARNLTVVSGAPLLTTEYGPALAGADCPAAWRGPLEGWWSRTCPGAVPGSDTAATHGAVVARAYVSDHLGAAPGVAAVRLGRVWNLWRPLQGTELETATGRPAWVSRLGLWYFYVMVPVAVVGALVLRRRRLLLFPFVAMVLLTSVTAVVAFGDARFAVEADVALAILAGVGLDAGTRVVRRWWTGTGRHAVGRAGVPA
jgi:4-amino-4-deoxy-L-arabinose transferase-like glycosyltransferase